ncbi:hypothetical protein [Nisaea sediminum]|uniref:hypothetical protein n=1 Tax=Nisaea sediminum TaxID=2775867 RepID=UPI0018669BE7|nr:hypothetical protein [Nisaea sediminum]
MLAAVRIAVGFLWPSYLIPEAIHDDALFVRLALSIRDGAWLGPYDHLTLAKGAAFPVFIAAMREIGLPLRAAEALLYTGSVTIFCLVLRRLIRSDLLLFILFALLLFAPVFWTTDLARIVREPLYASLSLLLFAGFLSAFLPTTADTGSASPASGYLKAAALGLCAGIYWLTREEGIWLLPALFPVVAYLGLTTSWRGGLRALVKRLPLLRIALALTCFGAVILAVNAVNYAAYGVFRNNEFRASQFVSAYGALNRIAQKEWRRRIVVPQETLRQAYEVSPAARELKPYFETEGKGWAQIACNIPGDHGSCSEIPAGWFMWALRDAARAAGHYRSAPETEAYFERLAMEINAACDDGRLQCLAPRNTMMPPFRLHYLSDALERMPDLLLKVLDIGNPERPQTKIGVPASPPGSEVMQEATGAATSSDRPETTFREKAAAKTADLLSLLARTYNYLIAAGLLITVAGVLAFGWKWLRDPLGVLVLSLGIAVAMRTALICFLDVTSIPGLNLLYFSPAYPHLVALCALGPWLAARTLRDRVRSRK